MLKEEEEGLNKQKTLDAVHVKNLEFSLLVGHRTLLSYIEEDSGL